MDPPSWQLQSQLAVRAGIVSSLERSEPSVEKCQLFFGGGEYGAPSLRNYFPKFRRKIVPSSSGVWLSENNSLGRTSGATKTKDVITLWHGVVCECQSPHSE